MEKHRQEQGSRHPRSTAHLRGHRSPERGRAVTPPPALGSRQNPAFISPPGKRAFVSKTYQQRVLVPGGSVPRCRAKAPLLLSNLPGSYEFPGEAWRRRGRAWRDGGTVRHGTAFGSACSNRG